MVWDSGSIVTSKFMAETDNASSKAMHNQSKCFRADPIVVRSPWLYIYFLVIVVEDKA